MAGETRMLGKKARMERLALIKARHQRLVLQLQEEMYEEPVEEFDMDMEANLDLIEVPE